MKKLGDDIKIGDCVLLNKRSLYFVLSVRDRRAKVILVERNGLRYNYHINWVAETYVDVL